MKSRSEKAIINTAMALLMELVAIISGLILPRLILSHFGSAYNGLTSSVTQFLSCAVLLRSGIGGATRAALYKPLRDNNEAEINAILSATNRFMHKIAYILGALIVGFACIYPLFVQKEFSFGFTFSLFIIMGIDTFFQSLLGITNYILLQADQKNYIPALAHIISYIVNTVIAVVLLEMGFGIHIVKLGSAFAFTLYPIMLALYVRKNYHVNFHVAPNNDAIGQRWDAFFHQVAGFVMTNTDTIVLTIFSIMTEVSVYSVYNMVMIAIRKMTKSFTDGLEAAFGSIMAEGKKDVLSKNFHLIESLIYDLSTFVSICAGNLLLAFVAVYTKGIYDADYLRPAFALLLVAGQFFNSVRQPYQLVVQAAGHYKQTKWGAIVEPILNITISVILVIWLGLIGVAIGTLVAIIFRTIQYSVYVHQNFVKGAFLRMLLQCVLAFAEYVLCTFLYMYLPLPVAGSYGMLVIHGIALSIIAGAVVFGGAMLFQHKDMLELFKHIKRIFGKKRKCH